jgi:hypothetical protein
MKAKNTEKPAQANGAKVHGKAGAGVAVVENGAEAQEAAPQAAGATARASGRKRPPVVLQRLRSALDGRRERRTSLRSRGRVVAIGVDVPKLDDLRAEAAQKADESAKPDGYEFGRPTAYRPEYAATARAMCRLGATDFDLAQEFGVTTDAIWRWRSKYPDFSDATMAGKEAFDNRIERSLAQRAAGYSYHNERLFCYEGVVVRAEEVIHCPPDVSACRLWLMNRKPDQWRAEKTELKLDDSGAFLKLLGMISDGTAPPFPGGTA